MTDNRISQEEESAVTPSGQILYAAVSTDRGELRSYATVIRADGMVHKAPLYEKSRANARKLYENILDLKAHGIPVVRHKLLEEMSWSSRIFHGLPYLIISRRSWVTGRRSFWSFWTGYTHIFCSLPRRRRKRTMRFLLRWGYVRRTDGSVISDPICARPT